MSFVPVPQGPSFGGGLGVLPRPLGGRDLPFTTSGVSFEWKTEFSSHCRPFELRAWRHFRLWHFCFRGHCEDTGSGTRSVRLKDLWGEPSSCHSEQSSRTQAKASCTWRSAAAALLSKMSQVLDRLHITMFFICELVHSMSCAVPNMCSALSTHTAQLRGLRAQM